MNSVAGGPDQPLNSGGTGIHRPRAGVIHSPRSFAALNRCGTWETGALSISETSAVVIDAIPLDSAQSAACAVRGLPESANIAIRSILTLSLMLRKMTIRRFGSGPPPRPRHPDGARATLLSRRGVCRDYAHLVVAFLRALDVPARVVGVYAPGVKPMDFHAVAEAYVDDGWHVVDATALGPRESFVRIATGADAADIAFLSIHHGRAHVAAQEVTAVVDELPSDDLTRHVAIG